MASNHEATIKEAVRQEVGEAVSGLRSEIHNAVEQQTGASRKQATPTDPDAGKFKVTAPGYAEQFTSKKAALASFDGLKKRLIKREEAATLRLLVQEAGSTKWAVVQELKLDEAAF